MAKRKKVVESFPGSQESSLVWSLATALKDLTYPGRLASLHTKLLALGGEKVSVLPLVEFELLDALEKGASLTVFARSDVALWRQGKERDARVIAAELFATAELHRGCVHTEVTELFVGYARSGDLWAPHAWVRTLNDKIVETWAKHDAYAGVRLEGDQLLKFVLTHASTGSLREIYATGRLDELFDTTTDTLEP